MADQRIPTLSDLTPEEIQYLASTPAGTPPDDVVPNFIDPPTNIGPLYAVSSLLLALSIIFACSRLFQKIKVTRKPTADDCVKYGKFGRHIWDVSIIDATSKDLLIPSYLVSVLTPPTMLFIKVTFFIMYLSIFGQWRWMRIAATVGGVITAAFYTTMTACIFAFTTPGRDETWESHQFTRGARLDAKFGPAQSAVGLGIDIYVLILPMIGIFKLQMAMRRKLGVAVIFMSAILACLGSVLSIVYRWKLLVSLDKTWLATPVFITTLLELQVGTMIACMPAMSQTCRRLVPLYDEVRGTLTRYYHIRLFSAPTSKGSEAKKDTLVGVINLYESDTATSGQPTRKDLYELYGTSRTVPAKTLQSSTSTSPSDGTYRKI
ncbi:MAG: hypothetical protein Q9216_002625 [Gyalolechia sp. 2 TL-2023]